MKRSFFVLLFATLHLAAFAQDETGGFKKENLFTGGNVNLAFFNGATIIGVSPYFGYSLNKYVDAGVSLNFNYTSQRDYFIFNDKLRQTVFGPGAFVRLFPFNFLFAQAHYEHNFIKLKYIPASGSPITVANTNIDANSLLIGGGYTSGRQPGNNTYYYFSILWDVGKNSNSPYLDGAGRTVPIIRAGYNIGLFQGRR